jgi:hypothetical protein
MYYRYVEQFVAYNVLIDHLNSLGLQSTFYLYFAIDFNIDFRI